jgi:WD40 repeat protein
MNGCPSDEVLGQFLAESLNAKAAEMLESHLEQCHCCQERLQNCAGISTAQHWREQLDAQRSSAVSAELGFLDRLANLSPQQVLNESREQPGGDVASAAWDGTVRLWDPATGQQTCLLQHE